MTALVWVCVGIEMDDVKDFAEARERLAITLPHSSVASCKANRIKEFCFYPEGMEQRAKDYCEKEAVKKA